MNSFDLSAICNELYFRAQHHPIGDLQRIRKELKGFARQPGTNIFSTQTIHQDWAFHNGGRSELQFNVGSFGSDKLRHGVAFSFEPSQTLPDIAPLAKLVPFFNDFVTLYSELFGDMRIWHWRNSTRSDPTMPGPIPPELVAKGIFVFFGKVQLIEGLDYELILNDFDRLLPLYRYVESGGRIQPISLPAVNAFSFRAGCSIKAIATSAEHSKSELDVDLRHNLLQLALHKRLAEQFGAENVGTELASGAGTRLDLVVRRPTAFWFYEIKTAQSARACIRQALAQLLEYSFWPGAQEAERLIVVGEPLLDKEAEEYLRSLTSRFGLPICYEQISL